MKHVFYIALGTFLMTTATEAQAQGLLRGLANKAKDKMEQKVGQALIGNKKNVETTNTSVSTSSNRAAADADDDMGVKGVGDIDFTTQLLQKLAAPTRISDVKNAFTEAHIDIVNDETKVFKPYANISEAIQMQPGLPTVAQILSQDETVVKTDMEIFNRSSATLNSIIEHTGNAVLKAKTKLSKGGTTTSAQRAMMNESAAQIFQLMQKHNIDPEKTSEKEMEAFVMKCIASGELKLPNTGGVINADYDEKQEEVIDKVSARLDVLNERVQEALFDDNKMSTIARTFHKELYSELQKSWETSETFKQVYELESDIDNRLNEFLSKHPDRGNDGAVIKYPAFWVEGRKKENALINQFNASNAETWHKLMKENYDKCVPNLKDLQELETELDAVFPDKDDVTYVTLKQNIATNYLHWMTMLQTAIECCYDMPLVETLEEEGQIIQ